MNNTTLETHPTVNACLWCGKDKGTRAKYCSRACCNSYGHQARKATAPRCNKPGCSKPVQSRGMCGSHYGQWHRTEGGKERTYTCAGCGIEHTTRRKPQGEERFCTRDCQRAYIARDEQSSAKRRQTMMGVDLARRSALRKAYEENSRKGILEAIRERAEVTENGCWEWKQLDSSGYPRTQIGDKRIRVHRLSLEVKHGAPLGSQAAHHICANTRCVNPEHLQPVTHRDNVAEMLARHSYLDRIAELEEVIKEIAPNHEVLDRVPLK